MVFLIYGFLAACVAGILQLALFVVWPHLFTPATLPLIFTLFAVIILACTEELSRYTFALRLKENLKHSSSFVSALFFGFGFACLELFIYFFVQHTTSWLILGIIGIHIFLSWITLNFITTQRRVALLVSLIFIHSLYNFLLLSLT